MYNVHLSKRYARIFISGRISSGLKETPPPIIFLFPFLFSTCHFLNYRCILHEIKNENFRCSFVGLIVFNLILQN